jgi:hypothetical protein
MLQMFRFCRERIPMKDELFNELLESVREGGAILRGEKSPSRTFLMEKPDRKRSILAEAWRKTKLKVRQTGLLRRTSNKTVSRR